MTKPQRSFTVEERDKAIKLTHSLNNCASCKWSSYYMECSEWCCDVEKKETCYKYLNESTNTKGSIQ